MGFVAAFAVEGLICLWDACMRPRPPKKSEVRKDREDILWAVLARPASAFTWENARYRGQAAARWNVNETTMRGV